MLTILECEVLALERAFDEAGITGARKSRMIMDRLDMWDARYYVHLNTALAKPEAVVFDAQTVRRCLARREERRAARSNRRLEEVAR